jgi:uncharacterized protein YciI
VKFVNFVKYGDLDRIAEARPAHFAYADRLRERGELAIGGPLIDDRGQRIGLLFIYEAASREAAVALARADPFALANAWSSSEITEWRLRGVNRDLLIKADRSALRIAGSDSALVRLFVNYARYRARDARLATVRPAHWAYDRALKSAGKLALAGPFADDEGGLFVYNAASSEEAMSCMRQDPFTVEGLIAEHELLEWRIEGVNPALLASDFPTSS